MFSFKSNSATEGKEETIVKETLDKDETKENPAIDVVSVIIIPLKLARGWPKRAEMTVIDPFFNKKEQSQVLKKLLQLSQN